MPFMRGDHRWRIRSELNQGNREIQAIIETLKADYPEDPAPSVRTVQRVMLEWLHERGNEGIEYRRIG